MRPILAGVPQGSVLSPLLFTLYTSDIPKLRLTQLALFADDTAIYYSGHSIARIADILQSSANALGVWFRKWRIEVNPEKSQAVLFHRGRNWGDRYAVSNYPITMFGQPIPWVSSAKYLGVILDRRLTFRPHLSAVRKRARQALGRLHSLVGPKSKLSLRNKVRLYTTCIRPIMTYASPVFAHVPVCRTNVLQTVQNKFMRRATGAPWFVRNEDLHIDLDLPTIRQYLKRCSRRFFESAGTHPNPLIVSAANYTPSAISRTHRPRHVLGEADDPTTLLQEELKLSSSSSKNRPRYRPRRRGYRRRAS